MPEKIMRLLGLSFTHEELIEMFPLFLGGLATDTHAFFEVAATCLEKHHEDGGFEEEFDIHADREINEISGDGDQILIEFY